MNTEIKGAQSDKAFQGSNTDLDYRVKELFLLDLDNTLVRTKSKKKFPEDSDDYQLTKMVVQNLKEINEHHPIKVVIVSNQGGIDAGFVKEEDVVSRIEKVVAEVKKETQIEFVDYFYCKSNDKNDYRRKPNIGMFVEATELSGIRDKSKIVMIGDASGKKDDFSDSDYMFSVNSEIDYLDVYDFQIKCTCGLRREVYERKCKLDPECWEKYLENKRKAEERAKMLEAMTEEERQTFFKEEAIKRQKQREQWEKEHPEEVEKQKKMFEEQQKALADEKEEQEKIRALLEEQRRQEQERLEKEKDFLSMFGAEF